MLGEYVGRLEAEEKERKDLQELLEVFVWQQRQHLRDTKKQLKVSATFFSHSELCMFPPLPPSYSHPSSLPPSLPHVALPVKTGEGDRRKRGAHSKACPSP